MSSFCQGIICIIWITWNSCRSVLHPVVILPPPLLSLSLYKMDALIWDSHPHNNNNSSVCGVCMELLFLHDGFEIHNLVIQSMMSLSLCLSLGYLQRSLLWDNWQHQWLFWNLQRHKDTDADITISCVPMDYRYIYVPMLHVYPLPFSSDSRSMKTNHEITRSYGEQILVAIWMVDNRVTLTDWWCWCLFCGWVLYSRASEMHPLIKIDNNGQVIHFNEKPRHESLSSMVCL